jgi:hypothetical protein
MQGTNPAGAPTRVDESDRCSGWRVTTPVFIVVSKWARMVDDGEKVRLRRQYIFPSEANKTSFLLVHHWDIKCPDSTS